MPATRRSSWSRHNTDGSPDTSFWDDGNVSTNFPLSHGSVAYSIALQPDGKIVLAGVSALGLDDSDFALARYDTDGALDRTFSGDGRVTTPVGGGAAKARAVGVQADGGIVVAGGTGVDADGDFAVARYTSNGTLDMGLSGDGTLTTDFGDDDGASGIAIQADGHLLAAGTTDAAGDRDFALARYLPGGALDPSFSADGLQTMSFEPVSTLRVKGPVPAWARSAPRTVRSSAARPALTTSPTGLR